MGCSSNTTRSVAQVIIGGNYFNAGSGDPSDDVASLLIIEHDPTDPAESVRVMALVFSPNAFFGFTPMGSMSVQQQAIAKVRWDKANHAFVFSIVSDALNASTTISYSGNDTLPPAIPAKLLAARAFVPNCTTSLPSADGDVLFHSVSVNP